MILVPVVREQQQHFPTTGISLQEALKKIQNFGTFMKKRGPPKSEFSPMF